MKTQQTNIHQLILRAGLFLLAGGLNLHAGNDTWNGLGADNNWGTSLNWTPGSANKPPVAGDTPIFDGSTRLNNTNTLTAATSFLGLTFAPTAGAFTLNGNSITTTGGIVDNSALNTETINLPIIMSGTHSVNAIAGGSMVLSGVISQSGTSGITKTGGGTTILNGSAVNTYAGTTTVNAGTLVEDFSNIGSTLNLISSSSALALGGGTLQIKGNSSAGSSQTFGSTTLNAGASTISDAPVSGANNPTNALGAITTTVGSTVVINGPAYSTAASTASGQTGAVGNADPSTGLQAATAKITTTSGTANNVLISTTSGNADYYPYATVGLYDFAAVSGSSPFTITGYSQISGGTANDGGYYLAAAGLDTTVANTENQTHFDDIVGSFTTVNASPVGMGGFRYNYNGAITTTVYNGNTVCVGTILVTPNVGANNTTITSNTASCYICPGFRSGSNAGSISTVQNNLGGLLIYNLILEDGKTAGGTFCQNGAGTVVYGAANTYTGQTYLNGGVSEITADSGFGAIATGAQVNMNGGTILANATISLDNAGANKRNVALGNNGGGLAAVSGNTMTVDGVVSGSGALIAGIPASAANGNLVGVVPGTGTGTANAEVDATGTVILSGANTYSGNTFVDSGTLALGSSGTINSTPQIYTAPNAIFDVSAVSSYTLGASQSIAGSGTVNGSVNTSSGSGIYAGTDGTYGTNTFNSNLTLASGALCYLDVGTLYNGSNDLISVGGTLTLNSTTFHLKAPSASINLDTTHDYVLVTAASITGAANSTPTWDIPPANAANFIVATNNNSVVLRYSASAPPSGSGFASPSNVNRNQSTLITVTATPGSSSISSVVLNTTPIGGTTVSLVRSNLSNVYTNTVTVGAGTAPGSTPLTAVITDNATLTANVNIALNVVNTQTWNGLAVSDSNWSDGANWVSTIAPVTGDFLTFAGATRTTPSMDANNNVTGLAFASGAASFTLGTPGNSLTLSAIGITNNSANAQTVNVPITLGAAQTFNASAGDLTLGQAITNGGFLLTLDGAHSNSISGVISGAGGLTKNGTGTNILTGNNSYAGTTTVNGGAIQLNSGGVINCLTVNLTAFSNAQVQVVSGSLTSTNLANVGQTCTLAISSGTANFPGGIQTDVTSSAVNADLISILTGGSLNAASITLGRTGQGLTAQPASGSTANGLYINGGTVSITGNLNVTTVANGNANSTVNARIDSGSLTVGGAVIIGLNNTGRWSDFDVNGGTVTVNDTTTGINIGGPYAGNAVFLMRNGTANAGIIGLGYGSLADTVVLSQTGGNLYVGSGGIVQVSGSATATVTLNAGVLGASASWSSFLPMNLSGTSYTIQAADSSGSPNDIALNGVLSGPATLTKTGGGTLTLGAADTYTGNTVIIGGTLVLGGGASINSPNVYVGTNTTFDVSALGIYSVNAGQTLAGLGTINGAVSAVASSTIAPGSNALTGTLTFASGLSATDANIKMYLTSDPTGTISTNDLITVNGDLTLAGLNTIIVTPIGSLGLGTYKLIQFSGTLNGDVSNLSCSSGTLVANPGEIDLVVTSVRPVASLVWRGDGSANLWDTATSSNWLNGASYDRFYTGDTNTFNDSATNFTVNIAGLVSPAASSAVTVNATNDYTFDDAGSGDISGTTGLTKTNTGKLTINVNNDYTGVTTINGGTLSVSTLADGGTASPIGAAGVSSANLVLNGGALEYLGSNKTIDRGATLQANNGTLSVASSSTTLTISGILTGPGSLTKTGNGQITLTGANNYAGGTVITDGTIRANPASAIGTNVLTLNGTTNAVTFQFSGDSQIMTDVLNVVSTNNFIANGGNDTMSGVTGSGTVNLNGSGTQTLSLQAIDSTAFTGTFYVNTLPFLRFFPTSGTTLNASNATFNLGTGTGQLINRDGGNYSLGALAGGPSTLVRGSANSGSAVTVYTIGGNNTNSDFSGVIEVGSGGTGARVDIVKVGTGTLTLSGANTYVGSTTISNGVLALGDGVTDGSLNSTNIDVTLGTVLDVSGRSDQTLTLAGSQTLRGNGTVRGSVTANASSTISPGEAGGLLGLLTITNSLSLNSTVKMDLDAVAHTNDVIVVQGTAGISYAGTLNLNLINGTLAAGQTFKLFNASSFSGAFATLVPATPGASLVWNISNLAVNGTISVVSTASPSIGNIMISGSDIILNSTNGTSGGQVIVLTSTNLALPLNQWTPLVTNNYDGTGSFSYTNSGALSSGAAHKFYILQTQ